MSQPGKADGPPAVAKKPPVAGKKAPPATPLKKPVPPPVQKKRASVSVVESDAAGSTDTAPPAPPPKPTQTHPSTDAAKANAAPPPPVKSAKPTSGSGDTKADPPKTGSRPPVKAAKPSITARKPSEDTNETVCEDASTDNAASGVVSPEADALPAPPTAAPKKPAVVPKKPAAPIPTKPTAAVPSKPTVVPDKPVVAPKKRPSASGPTPPPAKSVEETGDDDVAPTPVAEDDTDASTDIGSDNANATVNGDVGVIPIAMPEGVYETADPEPSKIKPTIPSDTAPPPRPPATHTTGDSASDSDPTHESNSTASDATCESVPAFDSNSDVGVVPIAIGDAVYETMDTAGAGKPQRPPPRVPPPVPAEEEEEEEIKSYKDRAGNAEIGIVVLFHGAGVVPMVEADGVYDTASAPVVASYELVAPSRPTPSSESNADVGMVLPMESEGLYETHDDTVAKTPPTIAPDNFDGKASKEGNKDVGIVCVADEEGLYETGNPDVPVVPRQAPKRPPVPHSDGDDGEAVSVASKTGNSDVGVVVLEDAQGMYETLDTDVGTGDHLFATSSSAPAPKESDSSDQEDGEEDLPPPPRPGHASVSGGPPPVVVPFAESGVVTVAEADEALADDAADDATAADDVDDDSDKKDGAKKKRWGAKLKGFGKKIQMRMGKKAAPDAAAKSKAPDSAGLPGGKSVVDDLSNEERLEILMQVSGQLSGGTMSVDEAIAVVAEKERAKRAARAAGVDTSEDVIEEYSAADEARERLASRAAATKTSAPPKRPPASTSTTQDSDAFALTDEERLAILLKAKAGISQEEIYGEVREKEREKALRRAAEAPKEGNNDTATAAPSGGNAGESTSASAAPAPVELGQEDLAVFDSVSQQGASALTHLTARRAKPPTKRPPTRAVLRGKRSTDHELVRSGATPASKMFAPHASLGGESSSDMPVPQPRARPMPTVRRRPESAPGSTASTTSVTTWLQGLGLDDKYGQRFHAGGHTDVERLRDGGLGDAELDALDITDTADRRALLTSLAMPAAKPRPTKRVRPKVVAAPTPATPPVVEENKPTPPPQRSANPVVDVGTKPVPVAKPGTSAKPSTAPRPDGKSSTSADDPTAASAKPPPLAAKPEVAAKQKEPEDAGGEYETFMDDPNRAPPVPAFTERHDTNATVGFLVCPTDTGVYDTCSEPNRGGKDDDTGLYEVPVETSGSDSAGGLPETDPTPGPVPTRPPKKSAPMSSGDAPPPSRPPKATAPALPVKQSGGSGEKEDPAAAELRRAVRKHIRDDKVELWNPPYSDATGSGCIPKSLADTLAPKVSASPEDVFAALEKLRVSARKKLNMAVVEGGATYATADA